MAGRSDVWHDGDMRARIVSGLFDSIWGKVARWQPPRVTRKDVHLAYAVAVTTDVAQFLFGPFGWAGFDQILDAVAMVVVSRLIGFHPLLLPTFVLEFVPFTDMLPTWTGCVAIVVALRTRQQSRIPPPPAPGPFIDV